MKVQRLRIVVGAVGDGVGGRALIVTEGLSGCAPNVTLQRASAASIPLAVSAAPVLGGPLSPPGQLAAELALRDIELFHVTVPAGLSGSVELVAEAGGVVAVAVFRPYPVAPRPITFALASCYYGYFAESQTYGEWLARAAWCAELGGSPIDFKILAGDNLYLDVADDIRDFPADRPEAEAAHRYAKYFVHDDALASALASSPTFTTFDDHDFWNDYPHLVTWLSRTSAAHRGRTAQACLDAIDTFLAPLNPTGAALGGRSYSFVAGGVPFFVADTRSKRSSVHAEEPCLLLEDELTALEQFLKAPGGPRVLVLGQPIWLGKGGLTDSNLAAYRSDFASIVTALAECPADVVVLAGDPHFSRVLELQTKGRMPKKVFEIVSSPAVHIPPSNPLASRVLDRSRVEIEDDVPFDCDDASKLEVARYHYGSSCNTTFAIVSLTPVDQGCLRVDARFVNHRGALGSVYAPGETISGYPLLQSGYQIGAPAGAAVSFTLRGRPQ